MNLSDLFTMCRQNLLRRKGRTILTMLGVMIGCPAIIIMVSIGVGSSESLEVMLQEMGDLTMIEVYGYGQSALNDDVIDQIRATPGVVAATPKQSCEFGFDMYAGRDQRYRQQWSQTYGMEAAALDDIGYELLEGDYPTADNKTINVIVGQYFAYTFLDTKRPEGQNMIDRYVYDENGNPDTENIPDAYFDPMTTPLTMEIYVDENKKITKEIKIVGVMKEDYGKGYETSEGMIMDIGVMQALAREVAQARGETVKKDADVKYDNASVKVSDISMVAPVQDEIKGLGFDTSSMESIREPMMEETHRQQLMFGGLGAISLFVAAIGIMNTMVMSITERTREIGVMKALGCYVRDIRMIFLLEAGSIGLLGGIAGLIVSFLISVGMNLVAAGALGYIVGIFQGMPLSSLLDLFTQITTPGSRISVIPVWLAFAGLLISMAIGVVSGFYPANKAVRIPALEAIRHE